MSKRFSEEKRLEWKERILKQQASDLSIDKWCHQNQIPAHCFHYWKGRLFPKQTLNRSSFTELTNANESGVFIEYHGVRIYLDRYFDPSILKRCLYALREIKC